VQFLLDKLFVVDISNNSQYTWFVLYENIFKNPSLEQNSGNILFFHAFLFTILSSIVQSQDKNQESEEEKGGVSDSNVIVLKLLELSAAENERRKNNFLLEGSDNKSKVKDYTLLARNYSFSSAQKYDLLLFFKQHLTEYFEKGLFYMLNHAINPVEKLKLLKDALIFLQFPVFKEFRSKVFIFCICPFLK
jgi:hypothetical protein